MDLVKKWPRDKALKICVISLNGRFWKESPPLAKTGFLAGYQDMLTFMSAISGMSYEEYQKLKDSLWPKLKVDEIKAALDRFFDVPENAAVPIRDGLTIVAARASGASEEQIAKMTADVRRSAGQTPELK